MTNNNLSRPKVNNSKNHIGWSDRKLRECSLKIGSGVTPKGGDAVYLDSGIPLIRSQNVLNGEFSKVGLKHITSDQHERMRGSKVLPDDVLFNITGASIGRCCLFPFELGEANVNQHVCIVRLKEDYSPSFFAFILISKIAKKALHESQAGGGREGLSFKNLGDFRVPVPPLPEQKAIADVLNSWDRGIRQLEAKLAAKRRIKKGLMQELLSGRRRLAGFGAELKDQDNASAIPEGWNSIKLGNVFSFLKSHAFSRDCLTTEHATPPYIYNIHYGDLHAYYTGALLDFSKERGVPILKSDPLASEKLEFLKDGDLIMADVSEDFEGVGACIELINLEQRKVTAGLHTFVRDTSGQTVEGFRGYLFKEHSVAKELRRIATGSSVHGISKTNLAKVDLTLPPIEEQQAIVRILNAADRELDALERKLTTWKAQKKYLLNNLVDGTIRLPQFI